MVEISGRGQDPGQLHRDSLGVVLPEGFYEDCCQRQRQPKKGSDDEVRSCFKHPVGSPAFSRAHKEEPVNILQTHRGAASASKHPREDSAYPVERMATGGISGPVMGSFLLRALSGRSLVTLMPM
ncbi:hypothetical protein P7K49_015651 [Saguinus oedipus]|uniref:Uncharacterized protein n=1 Tax=Saguinus oedipus TaxID=9490 RepID=A0ABQ9VA98_SAGOE|nr:hypothetical protein P7K49_015651 [Saguinus oedipus]